MTTTAQTKKPSRPASRIVIECAEDAGATRVKLTVAPIVGYRFGSSEMGAAERESCARALSLAAAYLRALPTGCPWCLPHVGHSDTWAGGSTCFVRIEHDGNPTAIATLQQVVAQASK
jgi:hypothetical protein